MREALREIFDPEIPVNIVDLGLIYDMRTTPVPLGGRRVDLRAIKAPFLHVAAQHDHIVPTEASAPLIGQRLGYGELSGLDLLELFAFMRPARFAVPTPGGFARALGMAPPPDDAAVAAFLLEAAARLLARE